MKHHVRTAQRKPGQPSRHPSLEELVKARQRAALQPASERLGMAQREPATKPEGATERAMGLEGFVTQAAYVAKRSNLFPTTAALARYIQPHLQELNEAQAVLRIGARWYVQPQRFDAAVMAFSVRTTARWQCSCFGSPNSPFSTGTRKQHRAPAVEPWLYPAIRRHLDGLRSVRQHGKHEVTLTGLLSALGVSEDRQTLQLKRQAGAVLARFGWERARSSPIDLAGTKTRPWVYRWPQAGIREGLRPVEVAGRSSVQPPKPGQHSEEANGCPF